MCHCEEGQSPDVVTAGNALGAIRIPCEEVTLELTNGLSPIVLTPVEEKYDFSYMVLPVRIKNS